MVDLTFIFVGAVFVLTGIVKGVIGLGLPTISMGLLAIVMPPVEAAAILILPSFATNAWQMLAGPSLAPISRRLWPMLVGSCIGTWAGIGSMSGAGAHVGTALLGAALALYGLFGLSVLRLSLRAQRQRLVGALAGAVTGVITAGTGAFVIPAVPYLQALGLEKDELVQALELSFTVSTLALAMNIGLAGALTWSSAAPTAWALVTASLGIWIGQERPIAAVTGRVRSLVLSRAPGPRYLPSCAIPHVANSSARGDSPCLMYWWRREVVGSV